MPFEKYNIKHHNQTERDVSEVTLLFDELISQVAMYVSAIELKHKIFKFKWFPNIRKRVDDLLKRHVKKVETSIENSVKNHWEFSNKKYDKLKGFNSVATRNAEGLQAFRTRKNRKLSKRIWKQTEQLRQELEMAIDTAIKDGTPVNKLATELKKYLKEPDRLHRRYRDNNGQLQLSKNAKAYHPGQGVYRSSYKNAERLARTEINRAYRMADIEQFALNPYVIGYEIRRSKHPYPCSICDMMQGRYPKSFIWGGNHPNCRCYLVPIMASDKDFINEVIPKQITTINPKLTKWIDENREKIANANSLPYFLSDNERFWNFKDIGNKLNKVQKSFSKNIYISFEPFSPVIIEHLRKIKFNKDKNKLFKDILNDDRTELLNESKTAKTTLHPNHKGKKSKRWKETKQMAKELNDFGTDVSFLPEYDDISSADAITKFKKKFVIADFKYSTTTKIDTLFKDLKKGFKQSECIVLKFEKGNTNLFVNAIEELKRKDYNLGNVILINKYGRVRELTIKDLESLKYQKMIKGFL